MFFALDRRLLRHNPLTIDVAPPTAEARELCSGGFIMIDPESFVTVTLHFGSGGILQEVMRDLEDRRASVGVHCITFEDVMCDRLVTINAIMERTQRLGLVPSRSGRLVYSETPVVFRQVRLTRDLVPFDFFDRGVITVGDGQYKHEMLAPGTLVFVEGHIDALGTGAGQTRYQLSVGLTDFLSTPGDFIVAGGNRFFQNAVLIGSPDFKKGDIMEMDCDGIPGNSDSAWARVTAWADLFKP